jgi:hypothetical protein
VRYFTCNGVRFLVTDPGKTISIGYQYFGSGVHTFSLHRIRCRVNFLGADSPWLLETSVRFP